MSDKDMHGEGNQEAAKEYNEKTKDFVESGKVSEAAENAKPADDQEAKSLEKAERDAEKPARS